MSSFKCDHRVPASAAGQGEAGFTRARVSDGRPAERCVPDRGVVPANGGRFLDPSVRTEMGGAFGHDFSGVRVHSGGEASELAWAWEHGRTASGGTSSSPAGNPCTALRAGIFWRTSLLPSSSTTFRAMQSSHARRDRSADARRPPPNTAIQRSPPRAGPPRTSGRRAVPSVTPGRTSNNHPPLPGIPAASPRTGSAGPVRHPHAPRSACPGRTSRTKLPAWPQKPCIQRCSHGMCRGEITVIVGHIVPVGRFEPRRPATCQLLQFGGAGAGQRPGQPLRQSEHSTPSFKGAVTHSGHDHPRSCSSGGTSAEGSSKCMSHSAMALSGSMKRQVTDSKARLGPRTRVAAAVSSSGARKNTMSWAISA